VNLTLHCALALALALAAEPVSPPAGAPPPTTKVEVVGTITTPPPPPVVEPSAARRTSARKLVVAGGSTLLTTYLVTTVYGVVTIDKARKTTTDWAGNESAIDHRGVGLGRSLLVPVVGPFLAMHYTRAATSRWLELFSGSAQVAGLVLTVVGAVRLRRSGKSQRVAMTADASGRGAMLGVSGRF